MRKSRIWESFLLILAAFLLLALGTGGKDQRELARQVVRLHVLANSDSEADQALKLQVRDAVLAKAEPLLEGAADTETARRLLSEQLQELNAAGQAAVAQAGYNYPVHTELTRCYFPTRHYTDFSLPAGEYQALRVEIGAAQGHNWWCVVYPPMCSAGIEEIEPAALGLSEDDVKLMTQDSTEYVIRFQCAEWFSQLERLIHD